MNINAIQDSFKSTVAKSVRLLPEGVDRYQIFTPFHFDDGDHFVITLRKDETGNWIITDEGHTYMHISYHMNLSSLETGSRNEIIEGALERYGVQENDGQILIRIDDLANAGNVFYNFIQCLINITDVSYLTRERVASTFMDDFKSFINETVPDEKFEFNYHNPKHDPDGKYAVDCQINGMPRPLHIYAIGNDGNCRDTTIKIFEVSGLGYSVSMLWEFLRTRKKSAAKCYPASPMYVTDNFPVWRPIRKELKIFLSIRWIDMQLKLNKH